MVVILGAGLAGLSASYHLGHENCQSLEQHIFADGHIHSERREGFTWDEGPHVSFTKGCNSKLRGSSSSRKSNLCLLPSSTLLKSAGGRFGSPTYTVDLARQLIFLLKQEVHGLLNAVNSGKASRFEYVAEILRLLHLATPLEKVDSNAFPRRANMPDNEMLDNLYLRLRGFNQMRDWKTALADYINKTYNV